MSELYKRIEDLCKIHNQTITTMCKESGASRASLSDLKMGRNQKLSAETLSKIAKYFGVTIDYLLTGFPTYKVNNSGDEENPWELQLQESFENMTLGEQIELVAHVQSKKAPTEKVSADILDEVDIGFYNGYKELDEADKEVLRDMVRVMRERRARKKED